MKFFLIILFALLFIITGAQFVLVLKDIYFFFNQYWYALAGLGAYLAYLVFTKRKNLRYWQTFTHELAHKLVGLLFFKKISSFTVSSQNGGEIEYYGKRNIFITLAPYYFPCYSLFLILINQFVIEQSSWIFEMLTAFTFIFYLHSVLVDTKPYQPDIKRYGYLLSYLFIATFNFFFLGIIILSYRFPLLKSFEVYAKNITDIVNSVIQKVV